MALILFIGEDYLKQNTPLAANIDINLITPNIAFAQDSYIQSMLGSLFYTSLQIDYSGQTMSTGETQLMTLIKPALAYRTLQESIPFLHIQLKNKGTLNLDAESGKQSTVEDMKYLKTMIEYRAEFYEEQAKKFLIANSVDFPNYILPDPTGILPETASSYTCDLYTKDYSNLWNTAMYDNIFPYYNGCGNGNWWGWW